MRIWQSAGRFQSGRGSAPGWIVAIARNAAIDRVRARKAPTRDIADMIDLADPGPTPEASAAASDDRRRIEGCLGRLPQDRARAVRAAYIEGYSYDELARALRRAAQHHADLAAAGADRAQEVPRVMSDASFLDDLPDDPDAALAAEYVLRLLDPAEEAACAARVAARPGLRRRGRPLAGRLLGARHRLRPGRAAAAAAGAHRGAALRQAAIAAGAALGQRPALARRGRGRRRRRPRARLSRPARPGDRAAGARRLGRPDRRGRAARRPGRSRGGLLRFTRLAGSAAPGRSFELWLLPEGETVPASLGVVPADGAVRGADPGGLRGPRRAGRADPRQRRDRGRLADRAAAGRSAGRGRRSASSDGVAHAPRARVPGRPSALESIEKVLGVNPIETIVNARQH